MAVLNDVKTLKNIRDTSRDNEINIYIRRATTLIKAYLNDSNADIENMYQDACIAYVIEQLNRKGNEAIKQYSQGSESGTYSSDLSDNVKALLPTPYVRMMG